jgi:hypothetical protein
MEQLHLPSSHVFFLPFSVNGLPVPSSAHYHRSYLFKPELITPANQQLFPSFPPYLSVFEVKILNTTLTAMKRA